MFLKVPELILKILSLYNSKNFINFLVSLICSNGDFPIILISGLFCDYKTLFTSVNKIQKQV